MDAGENQGLHSICCQTGLYLQFSVCFLPMQAVRELVHPARADWYEEFYAKAMNTTMRSYEAQVRRFWNIHCCLYKVSSHLS